MSKLTPTTKAERRARRHARVRAKVQGTPERPRLAVFRSNKAFSVQLIDDTTGTTLASAHTQGVTGKTLMEQATMAGEQIAKAAQEKNITSVVFDRGGFTYTGRMKALADAARNKGLNF